MTMPEGIVAGALGALWMWYAGFLSRHAWAFIQISSRPLHPSNMRSPLPLVTVLVPARNEENRIAACLAALAQQTYPADRWQLLVIDDHSTDDTVNRATQLLAPLPHAQVLRLANGEGKKAALTFGVERAMGEIILTTDADSQPAPQWIAAMVAQFQSGVQAVSGPVRMLPGRSLIGRFQALESAGLVALGAAGIALGRPHLANGANLAFRSAAFHAVEGYRGVDHIASGDDELLLQRMGRAYPGGVAFAKLPEAIVDTPACTTWAQLKAQRIRWVSKGRAYADAGLKLRLVSAWLVHFSLLMVGAFALFQPEPWANIALVGLGVKCVAELAVLLPAVRFLGRARWLVYFGPEQLLYIPFVVWAGLRGLWVRPYVWRGRVVE